MVRDGLADDLDSGDLRDHGRRAPRAIAGRRAGVPTPSTVLARVLAAGVLVTWPALLLVEELPSDGALNGKADDVVTGAIVTALLVGLLAAGWLGPLWAVAVAVLVVGIAVPVLLDAVAPRGCPAGATGMDCLPASFAGGLALPGVLVVCCGALLRRIATWRAASTGRT